MTWNNDDELEDIDFDDTVPEIQDESDLEDIEDWDDLEVEEFTEEIGEELDEHIVESSDGELIHHFDFVEDAIQYASGAPAGVLTVVIDENGEADVYREDYA